MDRFSFTEPGKGQIIYKNALEFIGAVRAGISWERFCTYAVRFSDALIDMLNDTDEVRNFLSSTGVSKEYVQRNVRAVFTRLHFNSEHNHYLTLALSRTASEAQIHKRWKDLMLIYHPDRNSDEDSASCAKRINEAYSVLKDHRKKTEYDSKSANPAGPHFTSHRKNIVRTQGSKDHLSLSPKVRSYLLKLIIPSCMAVSVLVLLTIFLRNWQKDYSYDIVVTPKQVSQDIVQGEKSPDPEKEKAKGDQENPPLKQKSHNPLFEPFNKPYEPYPEKTPKETDDRTRGLKSLAFFGTKGAPLEKPMPDAKSGGGDKMLGEKTELPSVSNAVQSSQDENLKKGDPSALLQKKPSSEQKETLGGSESSLSGTKETPPNVETEVFLFLSRYIVAYEEGDIMKFMDLFSQYAIENNTLRYSDIRHFYRKNFEENRYNYVLKNVRLEKRADPIIVSGDYSIKKASDNDKTIKANGVIRWTLNREEGALKIVRIDYERR